MKKFVIGNWKSNKNQAEIYEFFQFLKTKFDLHKNDLNPDIVKIICPAFIHLQLAHKLVNEYKLPVSLGAQNISPFDPGAYTGEVNGKQLFEYVSYCIIGHSERRQNFAENEILLRLKTNQAEKWGIKSIFCVQDENTPVPENVRIVAYEPVSAIGTGTPDTPDNALKVIKRIKSKNKLNSVVYGGSISVENINQYLKISEIDGVLVGGASLSPGKFLSMILNAYS